MTLDAWRCGYAGLVERQLLAVVEDLFFGVKIEAAARQAGWVVRFVKTAEAARAGAAAVRIWWRLI
jgi:hypothetical protein